MIKEKSVIYLLIFIAGVTLMMGSFSFYSTFAVGEQTSEKDIIEVDPPVTIEEEVKVSYSTMDATNEDVTAIFESSNPDIVVTNNEGKNTYVFEDNAEFVFEYINNSTLETGTITAKVDWIDKVLPSAEILYDYTSLTNKSVKATLVPSEEVIVLNNNYEVDDDFGNPIIGDPFEYIFDENGIFTFEFEDKVGNKGSCTAEVNWIDKVLPVATIVYDLTSETSLPVTATISFNKEGVVLLNNDGKNKYTFDENGKFTFEFQDLAGNKSNAVAEVNWIRKQNNNTNKSEEDDSDADDENVVDYQTPKESDKKEISSYTKPKDKQSTKKEVNSKKMVEENVEFLVVSSDSLEDLSLKKQILTMSESLSRRFSNNCDYFEIFFENTEHERKEIDIKDDSSLTILLDQTKKFYKIYSVTEDDKVQVVDFDVVSGNELKIKNCNVGKYLIEYEGEESSSFIDDVFDDEDNEDDSLNACIVICSCVIAALFLTAIICVFIKEY